MAVNIISTCMFVTTVCMPTVLVVDHCGSLRNQDSPNNNFNADIVYTRKL